MQHVMAVTALGKRAGIFLHAGARIPVPTVRGNAPDLPAKFTSNLCKCRLRCGRLTPSPLPARRCIKHLSGAASLACPLQLNTRASISFTEENHSSPRRIAAAAS
jgi:hypothetical protein